MSVLASTARCAGLALLLMTTAPVPAVESITGAGSSAAFPIYRTWAEEYARQGGIKVAYDPAGSSAGLKKIQAREIDFGASDVAPSSAQLARDELVLLPTAITGVVPVVNLPKPAAPLTLDGPTLAAIFMGRITRWNAPEIRALNPAAPLPAMAIQPVVRADGSGTTYNFANYLAQVSPDWKATLGVGNSLKWPGKPLAAKGSKGVSELIQATPGGIAYIDYNYVVENNLMPVALKNSEGQVITATPAAFRAAVFQSSWLSSGDFTQPLTNQPGRKSWPITMGTFVMIPRVASHPERATEVARYFTWALLHGDELTGKTNFVRLPDSVQAKAFRALAEIVDLRGTPLGVSGLK